MSNQDMSLGVPPTMANSHPTDTKVDTRDEQIRSLQQRVEQLMTYILQNATHDTATSTTIPPATTTTIAHNSVTPPQMSTTALTPARAEASTPQPSTLALEHIRQSVAKVWAAIPQS